MLSRPSRALLALSGIAVCAAAIAGNVALAACSFEVGADPWVQLLPAGEFKPRDGRDMPVKAWRIDRAIAEQVIARFTALATPLVFDYEHQTIMAEDNGLPAPAAGFITELQWREGAGLFALVDWTARAKGYIEAREYRYVSPVFAFDKKTGAVTDVLMAALTNNPAIDGMAEISARAAARYQHHEETDVTKISLLAAIIAGLGLAADTTEDAAAAACVALKTKADGADTEIATLKSRVMDPSKFVPLNVFEQLKTDFAALKAKTDDADVEVLVQAGLDDGRLIEAQTKWARDLGKSDIAALKSYLDTSKPIAALLGPQTKGKQPSGAADDAELTVEEVAICKNMGVTPEAYKAERKRTSAAA